MILRKLSETTTTITLGWDLVPLAEWYLFYANGVRVANAAAVDKNGVPKTTIKFSKGGEPYEVVAVKRQGTGLYTVDAGVWSPSPPPGGRTPLPPVGPFVTKTTEQFFRDGDGLLTEKLYVDFTPTNVANTAGIGDMRWPYTGPSSGTWVLRDCKVSDVAGIPPLIRDGTGEAGFWIGEKTQGERLEAWNNAWMNMVTLAACRGSRFTDVDLHDNPHVGLYMEHVSTDVEFRRSSFGGSRLGVVADSSSINVEWWYPSNVYGPTLPYGGKAGSFNCTFIDCEIYCPPAQGNKPYEVRGAFLDAGTFGFLFQNCRFYGPGGALGFPNKLVDASRPNRAVDCVFDQDGPDITYHDNVIG